MYAIKNTNTYGGSFLKLIYFRIDVSGNFHFDIFLEELKVKDYARILSFQEQLQWTQFLYCQSLHQIFLSLAPLYRMWGHQSLLVYYILDLPEWVLMPFLELCNQNVALLLLQLHLMQWFHLVSFFLQHSWQQEEVHMLPVSWRFLDQIDILSFQVFQLISLLSFKQWAR